MKSIQIVSAILSVFIISAYSHAQNYQFASEYDTFWVGVTHYDDGTSVEQVTFRLFDSEAPYWRDIRRSDDHRFPVMGDVIEKIKFEGPEGSGLVFESDKLVTLAPFSSIDGRYKTDPVRIEYDHNMYWDYWYGIDMPNSFVPHPAGNYTLTVNCTNGQSLVAELPLVAAVDSAQFPTPQNVSMTLNGDGTLDIFWNNPIVYNPEITFRVIIEAYKDGSYQRFRVRMREIPSTFTSIRCDKEAVDMLLAYSDQLKVQVWGVWYITDQDVLNENYSFSKKISYMIENGVLVKKEFEEKKSVVVVPLMNN